MKSEAVQSLSIKELWSIIPACFLMNERLKHVFARRSERAPVLCGYNLNCGWRLGSFTIYHLKEDGGNAELKRLSHQKRLSNQINHEPTSCAGDRRIMKGSHPEGACR